MNNGKHRLEAEKVCTLHTNTHTLGIRRTVAPREPANKTDEYILEELMKWIDSSDESNHMVGICHVTI